MALCDLNSYIGEVMSFFFLYYGQFWMQQHVQNFDCQLYGERKPANECAQPANETRSKNQIQDKIMN